MGPGPALQQLREQRRYLNELLRELQGNRPSGNSTLALNNTSGYTPSNTDIRQVQRTLLDVMRNITPMINAIAQSGVVSRETIDHSKLSLLTILNSVHSRDFDQSDDSTRELNRITQLTNQLVIVLDEIIAKI